MTIRSLIIACVFCSALCGAAESPSPEQRVNALFKQLNSEQRATAFQDFFKGSLTAAQKEAYLKAMDVQARGGMEFYGPPASYEIFERKEIGKSLFRIRWLTKHKDETPLFWSALFYLRAGSWEPLNVQFFDDPSKAGI